MNTIVADQGFSTDTWDQPIVSLAGEENIGVANATGIDLASDTDPDALPSGLNSYELIRVDFPSSADGRGFTLARILRLKGFRGKLRAKGHVLADQYAMARRAGFDEVEIDDALAARQPEEQWQVRSDWKAHNYQARLRAMPMLQPGPAVVAG